MDREKFIEGMKSSVRFTIEERKEILDKSIRVTGPDIKHIIAMEELAELQQQISKMIRGEGNRFDLLEEMADVYICLYYLSQIYNLSDVELWRAVDVKIQREKERRQDD